MISGPFFFEVASRKSQVASHQKSFIPLTFDMSRGTTQDDTSQFIVNSV